MFARQRGQCSFSGSIAMSSEFRVVRKLRCRGTDLISYFWMRNGKGEPMASKPGASCILLATRCAIKILLYHRILPRFSSTTETINEVKAGLALAGRCCTTSTCRRQSSHSVEVRPDAGVARQELVEPSGPRTKQFPITPSAFPKDL